MKTFVLHIFCNLIVRQFKTICVNLHLQNHNGSVAQLNRASDSGSEGRGFESHRNHQGVQLSQLHLLILGGYGIPAIPTQPQSQQSAAPFYFRAERLGREKILKVVGLNPTGITRGCSLSRLHIFILGGYGIPAIPTQPQSQQSLLHLFIYPRSLDTSTFVIRIDRRRCPHRPMQMVEVGI